MKKEKVTIIIILLVVVAIGFVIYASMNKNVKKANNEKKSNNDVNTAEEAKKPTKEEKDPSKEEDKKEDNKKEEININYNSLKKELIARIDNDPNTNAYLETCNNFERERTDLSVTSVEQLIEKLQTATSIEKTPTSVTCPSYSYTVSTNIDNDMTRENIIIAMYANDHKTLLVGIKGEGYAFSFDTDLNGFLENLK